MTSIYKLLAALALLGVLGGCAMTPNMMGDASSDSGLYESTDD